MPAEELRLNTTLFREGLKQRGLTEVLALHLREFPPRDDFETLRMLREVRLAQYADENRPAEERQAALAEANRILEQMIENAGNDQRRFEWRFELARSLLFEQAEPYLDALLYRLGTTADRAALRRLTARAVRALRTLLGEIDEAYARIDRMSAAEFERANGQAFIDALDRLGPRAQYLLLWALLYDSVARPSDDPTRLQQLREVALHVKQTPALINVPHGQSHVQIQALVLAGMAHRRLGHHELARDYLSRALEVADNLDTKAELDQVRWAVILAWMERVRNEIRAHEFAAAERHLTRFQEAIKDGYGNEFAWQLSAALLERGLYRARAEAARRNDEALIARDAETAAWRALDRLASQAPEYRDRIYSLLYDAVEARDNPASLDPIEQAALISGLLYDARRGDDNEEALDRAIAAAERFLADAGAPERPLVPEVLYNLAVAHYRRGQAARAVRRFIQVAREHPDFNEAPAAVTHAVRIASDLYDDPALRERADVRALYENALEVLLKQYPATEAARRWRFYYAQLLDEQDRFAEAAREYATVEADHERYLEALFLRARALALLVQERSGRPLQANDGRAAVPSVLGEFLDAQRRFISEASAALTGTISPQRQQTLAALLAQARLLAAEVYVLPGVDRAAQALDILAELDGTSGMPAAFSRRIWRTRLHAYLSLKQFDEAREAMAKYIEAEPESAGPTLQALYDALTGNSNRPPTAEKPDAPQAAAATEADRMGLALARAIVAWADAAASSLSTGERHALTVQLAEAHLGAQDFDRARTLFEELMAGDAETSTDVRVLYGYAEALFHLGDHAAALPVYNRLATQLPPTDDYRWAALLRDLQCRTALGQAPADVIKVIEQQERLYPEMGGPDLSQAFAALKRENVRRRDAVP